MKHLTELEHGQVLIGTEYIYNSEYAFRCYRIWSQTGCILIFPFFNIEKKDMHFEGYLIYHDKNSIGYSEHELMKMGLESISNHSPSGMVGNLSPLPYKPISYDDIEEAIESIINKNTFTILNQNLFI